MAELTVNANSVEKHFRFIRKIINRDLEAIHNIRLTDRVKTKILDNTQLGVFGGFRMTMITSQDYLNSSAEIIKDDYIDLEKLYNIIAENMVRNIPKHDDKIWYIEFGSSKKDYYHKGLNPKDVIDRHEVDWYINYGKNPQEFADKIAKMKQKKKNKVKRFDNQLTIIYKYRDNFPSVKIFQNGRIHMAGLKYPDYGTRIVEQIYNILCDINCRYDILDMPDPENFSYLAHEHYTINSVMVVATMEHKLRRDKFHNYMVINQQLQCIYKAEESSVKIYYYYNAENPTNDGICKCPIKCRPKKKTNKCKIITFLVFEGKCNISGAKSLHQVLIAYHYVMNIIKNNIDKYQRLSLEDIDLNDSDIDSDINSDISIVDSNSDY